MIKEIKSIKNVGQFESFSGTEEFEKNTILFGFNGAGKSTLSDIFYSLTAEGRMNSITRRRTLNRPGEEGEKTIEITLSDGLGRDFIFNNDTWNELPNNMYVFNNQYIDDHVFVSKQLEGDVVPIGMGPDGTKYMKQREGLNDENKELLKQINEDITNLMNNGIKIKDFSNTKVTERAKPKRFESMASFRMFSMSEKATVEEKIRNNTKYTKELGDIETCNSLYGKLQGMELIDKALLLKSVKRTPRVSSKEIADFLSQTLTVADIKWAVAGYKNQKDKEICPMCGQTISDKKAIALFNKLGRFVNQHKDENVKEFCYNLNLLVGRLQMLNLANKVKIFNEIVKILSMDSLLLKRDIQRLQKGLAWNDDNNAILNNIIEKTYVKVENPYAQIAFTQEEIQCLTLANGVIKNIHVLGDIIGQTQVRLGKKIDKKMSMDDMSILFKLSYGPDRGVAERIKVNANKYIGNQRKIEELNGLINDCYNQIGLDEINKYLAKLNTRIKLEVSKNIYYIRLKDFNRREYEKNNDAIFSEGEQRAIAFAYFLAEINDLENEEKESIIVIDDPISSMDLNRKSMISYQIAEMMKNDNWQIIAMTHDITFVERIEGFLVRGVSCKKLELRSEKADFLQLNLKDYLTDDEHIYKELIHDAESSTDELTKIVALMSLRPYASLKGVSGPDFKTIMKKSTYFAHTLYSQKGNYEYKDADYTKLKLREYIDFVAAKTGEVLDSAGMIGEYSFKGFDFNSIAALYMSIPLDSMKNARKKALLMRPLIEACFFQLSDESQFHPKKIGAIYEQTKRKNKKDKHRYDMCVDLLEMYNSSKKYHHGADEGSLLGISWINPNEIEHYDQVLNAIISDIRAIGVIRALSA